MSEKDEAKKHLEVIRSASKRLGPDVTVMEICGGHTNVIMRYGLRDILPENIRLISGPGCPVCVSSQKDIDSVIALAENQVPVATYGDMLRVPGTNSSLAKARAKGANVYEVYSTEEVLKLRQKHEDIVFFGVGFETTTPMTCHLLENKVSVYSVHKLVPPAMKALISGDVGIDGFINPGHVSAIIGANAYKDIRMPQVICGFTPERILRGLALLVELIADGKDNVVNGYPEVVRDEGNEKAKDMISKCFEVQDSDWRGLGTIAKSGLKVKDKDLDAQIKYEDVISKVPEPQDTGCICGSVLKGQKEPVECPLFGKACTPQDPVGACMVSSEGSCAISYRYKR